MTKHVIELNSDNFETSIALSNKPSWVTFGASWCPPCKAFSSVHEEVAKTFDGRVLSFHVDIDHFPDLADKFEIKSVPTHLLFKGGTEVKRIIGAVQKTATETAYLDLLD
jgi:thioredoxin